MDPVSEYERLADEAAAAAQNPRLTVQEREAYERIAREYRALAAAKRDRVSRWG